MSIVAFIVSISNCQIIYRVCVAHNSTIIKFLRLGAGSNYEAGHRGFFTVFKLFPGRSGEWLDSEIQLFQQRKIKFRCYCLAQLN